ncbi:MAG: protein-L-isoaspartate(D-aspartate) O-methyltransferase [Candidatus Woesearchaeota archaeon]
MEEDDIREENLMRKESLIRRWKERGIVTDRRILDAFRDLPRERFVLDEYEREAYSDTALPLLKGQTISQPTTMMVMLQALEMGGSDTVLEIGAGSGYNAALLSKLAREVYAVETIKELADYAKQKLDEAGISNVHVIHMDGSKGYPEKAPYDRIIMTAACREIPKPVIGQLKEGGIIIAPVGPLYSQKLFKGIKRKDGGKYKLDIEVLGDFVFVPLTGEQGHDERERERERERDDCKDHKSRRS